MFSIAIALAIVISGGHARAQDDEEIGHDDVPEPTVQLDAMRMRLEMQLAVNTNQVDQWLFGRVGGPGPARSKLESALALRIDDLERAFGLTAAQQKKLKLAGYGDLKLYFDRVDAAKRRFTQMQNNPNHNIWQEVQPLQVEFNAGIFGDGSIFGKAIGKTLSADQAARYESMRRERIAGRRRAVIDWFVVHIDKGLGLSDEQRSRLVELLVKETPAPARYGQGDYWFLMYEMSRLPEDKLRSIFDAPQWRLLRRQLGQARGMEQWLRSNGILADGDTADRRTFPAAGGALPARLPAPAFKKAVAPQLRAREVQKK
jgi:hypothetical protein